MNKTIEFDWEGKPGLGFLKIPVGNIVGQFHIRVEMTQEPDPPCPVCGKLASEHRDGLFCCAYCGNEGHMNRLDRRSRATKWRVQCVYCWDGRTYFYPLESTAREAWNRRA